LGYSTRKSKLWSKKNLFIIGSSLILLAAGLIYEFIASQRTIAQLLFLAVLGTAGHSIIRRGFSSLVFQKRLDMNFLMTIAATGAFLIGHGEEGAAVIFLFFMAESLEEYAEERTKNSVAALIRLAPETATIRRKGREEKVHVHEVKAGETILIKPGERIPLDGIVVKGTSTINQAPITGESIPVTKTKGNEVFAGTINEESYLEIRVSKTSHETMLSKIVKLVENAQKQKSKTEKFIDRFAKYYTPAVMLLALGVAVVPTLIFGQPLSEWIYKALVLLVVSCPCALAISTPVSMVSGITSAAKNGVLIKGGSYLEEMRKVRVLAFDKTGTLTEGKPEVMDVISLNAYPKRELLQVAVSLEFLSKHPIAEAIAKRVQKEKIKPINIEKFESVAGKGVKGEIDGTMHYLGNKNFFKEIGIDFPEGEVKDLENQGKTVILIGNDSRTVGIVTLMDKIREGAAKVIRELKKDRVRTVMLTGDNERVAKAIAHQLDIDEYYSELLPEEKVRMVEELLRKYERVVMVGDGVNDAPALAKAHVGIAMGAIGSDVAIETSDVALMQDDLSKVSYLIKLSKRTIDIVRQNVFASILIKGSFAVLVFPGIVSLWLAVAFGDMGLSLGVILNAIRLGRTR
jgi:Cd2+/Zn2+-exporting ATPase